MTKQNRLKVYLSLGVFFVIAYLLNNHFHLVTPVVLEMTIIDQLVPFLPWTSYIYVTDYIFPFVVGYLIHSSLGMTRVSVAFFLMIFFTNLTFILLPVSYPRELYPLAQDQNFLLYLLRKIDTPANCFPSAHVATVWTSTLAIQRERPKLFIYFLIWALLIIISTLTTKQHFLVDIIGGVIVGHFCYRVAEKSIHFTDESPVVVTDSQRR